MVFWNRGEKTGKTQRWASSFRRRHFAAHKRYQNLFRGAIVFWDFRSPEGPAALIYWLRSGGGTLRYLDRLQPLALLVMRLALGAIMVAHGYQNVFRHLGEHVHLVTSLGLPASLGYVSAFTELLGGLLLLAGFFTRAAAFAICIDLVVAIWKVHWHNGLIGEHGSEFPLALATLAFALIFFGAGPIALDHVLRGGSSSPRRG
jgi:putative oxidoreductase